MFSYDLYATSQRLAEQKLAGLITRYTSDTDSLQHLHAAAEVVSPPLIDWSIIKPSML